MSPHHSTWRIADWDRASPHEAVEWFANVSVPWWIAGGWAIDLFLNCDTRPHKDLDIGVLRCDIGEVLRVIPGWQIFEAKDGVLTPLSRVAPRSDVSSLWCRRAETQPWKLELMLDESDGEFWVYRRDPGIRRHLQSLVCRSGSGIPYLAPEVQLLYKAKHARPQDELDFEAVVPHLSTAARSWLRENLARTLPSHSWTRALGRHHVA